MVHPVNEYDSRGFVKEDYKVFSSGPNPPEAGKSPGLLFSTFYLRWIPVPSQFMSFVSLRSPWLFINTEPV